MRAFGLFDPDYVNLNPVPPVSSRPEMWEDFVAIDLGLIKFRELRGLGFSWVKSACNIDYNHVSTYRASIGDKIPL